MQQLIEKNRNGRLASMLLIMTFVITFFYLLMSISISVIVPCNIVDYQQNKIDKNGQEHFTESVTVEYRHYLATVEFDHEKGSNATDYYSHGTALACEIHPYSYNVIGAVYLEHYSYDIVQDKNVHVRTDDEFYVVAVMIIVFCLANALCYHDEYTKLLKGQYKREPDQFKIGQKTYEMKVRAVLMMGVLCVFVYTTVNSFVFRHEPCVVTKYEEVLHDYSGSGSHDNRNFVKVKVDVQVVTFDLYVGKGHMKVYEGSYENISSIRDYYRTGQNLTCKIYPTRFNIVDSVSVLDIMSDSCKKKAKKPHMVQTRFDYTQLNVMLSGFSGCILYVVLGEILKTYESQKSDKQFNAELTYEEPIVLSN
jgi:hypothetical protein